MVAAVEQIDRELKAIEKSSQTLGQEFYESYKSYLTILGQAVKQQLILASYHLCTQRYPDRFLQLSYNQRQQLQQALQTLGRQAQQQLTEQLPVLQQVLIPDQAQASPSIAVSEPQQPEANSCDDPSPDDDQPDLNLSRTQAGAFGERAAIALATQRLTPPHLLLLLEKLEHYLVEVLQGVSQAGNQLLQQAGILPQELPEPVFAAAAKAGEMVSAVSAGPPNLLNMLVEIPGSDAESEEEPPEDDLPLDPDSLRSSVTPLVAIHLRLLEIEFADSTLSARRSKIRDLASRLERLLRQYRRKQQEREVAEAEAAWRASWYE